jgi:hypothetical protein
MYLVFDIGGTKMRLATSKDLLSLDKIEEIPTAQNFDEAMGQFQKMVKNLTSGEKIFVSLRVNNCDFNLDESNYFEKVLGNIKAGDDLYSSNNKVYLPLEFRIHTEYCNLVGQTLLPSNQIYQMLISYPNQKPNAENTPIILKKKVINFNRNFYLISYSILLISVPLDIVTSPIQIASLVILNALYRGVR